MRNKIWKKNNREQELTFVAHVSEVIAYTLDETLSYMESSNDTCSSDLVLLMTLKYRATAMSWKVWFIKIKMTKLQKSSSHLK